MDKSDDKKTNAPYDRLYETPDSTNCAEKVMRAATLTGYVGIWLTGYDLIGYSKPSTVMAGVTRAGSLLLPAAAVGAVYSTTVCLSSKITGYDDGINHIFGGIAAGSIIGARVKSAKFGCLYSLVFAMGGYLAKKAYVENVALWPRQQDVRYPQQGSFWHYNTSYDPWKKEVKG